MMAYEPRLFAIKGVVDKDHRFLWPFCLCFLLCHIMAQEGCLISGNYICSPGRGSYKDRGHVLPL